MTTGGNRNGRRVATGGDVLLEVLFAVLIGGIFIACLLSGIGVGFDSSHLTSLAGASMIAAQDGAAKISSCPYDKILATNWPPEVYELFVPIAESHFYSTNFYIITETNMTKLIDIHNVFDYHGHLITNKVYFLSFVNP